MKRCLHPASAMLATLALVMSILACDDKPTARKAYEHFYNNFQTVAADAPQNGYTPYWFGREFVAGGLTFEGPTTDDFAQEVEGGGSWGTYGARGSSLDVISYSPAAWAKVRQPTGTETTVDVAGHTATMITQSTKSRPVLNRILIVKVGETTVVTSAASGGPLTPGGPEANPLIDEATFLGVMQELRPYPQ